MGLVLENWVNSGLCSDGSRGSLVCDMLLLDVSMHVYVCIYMLSEYMFTGS